MVNTIESLSPIRFPRVWPAPINTTFRNLMGLPEPDGCCVLYRMESPEAVIARIDRMIERARACGDTQRRMFHAEPKPVYRWRWK